MLNNLILSFVGVVKIMKNKKILNSLKNVWI